MLFRFGFQVRQILVSTTGLIPMLRCAHSTRQRIDPMTGATWMTQSLCGARLWDYLCSITTQSWPRKVRDDFSIRYSHFSPSFLSITNKLPKPLCKSLNALYAAGQTYSGMVGATISLSIISRPLHDALWVPALVEDRVQAGRRSRSSRFNMQDEDEPIIHGPILDIQSRSQAFACITHLDSGTLVLNPKVFNDTLAVCSEDSIYVTSVLLSDPADTVAPNSIRRLVGNIGRSGVCMLVAPVNPKIRRQKYNYSIVTHAPFDLKREDNFRDTTLHLCFTDWTLPIEIGDNRTIDQEVYLVEVIVSVRDRGEWMADLDILGIDFTGLTKLGTDIECPGIHEEETRLRLHFAGQLGRTARVSSAGRYTLGPWELGGPSCCCEHLVPEGPRPQRWNFRPQEVLLEVFGSTMGRSGG